MTFQLNNSIAAMSCADFGQLSSAEKLQLSSYKPNELPFHHTSRVPGHMQKLHFHPPHALGNALQVRPHTARLPKLPKRPLNSWMAFRSFYSGIFANMQQKDASHYLTILWQQDPFKAKWTIIARAYSSIRDYVGKPNAPLDRFLGLIAPEIGVVAVSNYLGTMKWYSESDSDGTIKLSQIKTPDISSFPANIVHTSMTEKDVIHFCAKESYISTVVAEKLAGPCRTAQQGLLASAPVFSRISPPRAPVVQEHVIKQFVNNTEMPEPVPAAPAYQWTGSMSDLYKPAEGSLDFVTTDTNLWGMMNIQSTMVYDFTRSVAAQGGLVVPWANDEVEKYLN